jgi:hypothetical protein
MSYLDIPPILDFETQIGDLPEVEVRLASSRKHSSAELRLAVSLVAYVFGDDAKLPREQFLRLVIDRIVDALSAPLALARADKPAPTEAADAIGAFPKRHQRSHLKSINRELSCD